MTIQRTREIFGTQLENMSDQQVQDFISNVGILCDGLFEMARVELTNQGKNVNNVNSN